jgi:glutamyl-tRNA synthetase
MEEGYAPEAVLNYLCLLGWSPKDGREVMTVDEVIERFDLPQVLRHNARFDLEKLKWLNGEHTRLMTGDRFHELAVHALTRAGVNPDAFELAYVKAALDTCKGKTRLFSELPAYGGFYFTQTVEFDPQAAPQLLTVTNKPLLAKLRDVYAQIPGFDAASLEAKLKETAKELGVKNGVLVHPARFACTGKTAGPSLYHLMEILGRDRVLQRFDAALSRM